MKETTPENWDEYWQKRENKGIKTLIPRLHHLLLRLLVDRSFIETAIKHSKKGKIVEVGCGVGLNSILIAKKRGDKVILVDFSEKALKKAKEIAKEHQVKVETIKHDIRNKLPFKDKEATLAWSVGTIEHFGDPVRIVKEMKRISECTICIVPMRYPLRLIYEKVRSLFGLGAEGYYVLYIPEELEQIFKKAGFKNIKTKKYIFFLGFISFCCAIGAD